MLTAVEDRGRQAIDANPERPYFALMVRKSRLRVSSVAPTLLSATLILCLVTAPICATRCAAHACLAASSAAVATCHQSTDDCGATGWKNKASEISCASGEIVFTAARFEERNSSPKSSTGPNFLAPFRLNLAVPIGTMNANDSNPMDPAFQPGFLCTVAICSPLRI
jgi:hypothetical protein